MNILVTGCAGFIGSHFVDMLLDTNAFQVYGLDNLTYAGTTANLRSAAKSKHFKFEEGNILTSLHVEHFLDEGCTWVVNFAAESHVDNSIRSAEMFYESNVVGVGSLLEQIKAHKNRDNIKFLQVGTDEVYGSIDPNCVPDPWEADLLDPTSPYAASKAAADLVALSYYKTFGIDVRVTRSTNNYGPRQHYEKFIPQVIGHASERTPITLYDDGSQIRDWLSVYDNCRGIATVMNAGKPGMIYNIGANLGKEWSNREIAEFILRHMNAPDSLLVPSPGARPGHDQRYAVDTQRITELGWKPQVTLEDGLIETVNWYLNGME
jgi:dTDP-glucose 4,6-dehydratase